MIISSSITRSTSNGLKGNWRCEITIEKVTQRVTKLASEIDAALTYDRILILNNKLTTRNNLNFPDVGR